MDRLDKAAFHWKLFAGHPESQAVSVTGDTPQGIHPRAIQINT